MKNGLAPAPAPTVTSPIFAPLGHASALACVSVHSSALAILPVRPLGRLTVRALRSWSVSSRVKRSRNDEALPALLLSVPALKPGENVDGHVVPLLFSLSVKLLSEVTVLPFQPVRTAWVVYVPHLLGATSGARGPPLNSRCRLENGICGLLSNVVVI